MNKFGVSFEPLFPIGWVIGLASIAFAILVWLEMKKKQKLKRYRIAAVFFIVLSITNLILRPFFSTTHNSGILLLTPRYDKAKVDSILKLNPTVKIKRIKTAEPFPNSEELSTHRLSGDDVKYIFGEGLPKYALDEVRAENFVFLPAPLPVGVVELNLPELFSGRINTVSGIFNAKQKTKLKLVGPGGVEDSTVVDQKRKSFSFSFVPKLAGLFTYDLISEDSLGAKTSERLPIDVKSPNKLRVFFMQDFPSSEFRYLKNFLSEGRHSIVVRTRTSKANFTEEFINVSKFQTKNISVDLLNRFDLLLADSKAIAGLPLNERSNIEQAVRNGLGLIVAQDQPSKKNEFYSIGGRVISTDTAHFQITNKGYVLPALPIEIQLQSDINPILRNKKRVLAGYRFFGAGRIGFQLLRETFRIKLEGNGSGYSAIWSTLIEKVSRKKTRDFDLWINTCFPYYPDEPISFSITATVGAPKVSSDGIKIPLEEDVIISDYWHGKTWVSKPGWHQLGTADSSAINYFVHEISEWEALRAAYSSNQTKIATARSLKNSHAVIQPQPISPLIFYFIFLFAAGFLWLAPKI